MRKAKQIPQPKAVQARTTSLYIVPLSDFSQLGQHYELVRFELPAGLKYGDGKKRDANFASVHTAMKEGLDAPYRLFTYDPVGNDLRWAVYALFKRQSSKTASTPYRVNLDGKGIPGERRDFSHIPYHVLIKLLQVAFFRESIHTPERFIGQDKCYVQVMKDPSKYVERYLCLEMEIRQTRNAADNLFYIDEHAQYFRLIDKEAALRGIAFNYYYAQVNGPDDTAVAFRQLKRSELEDFGQRIFSLSKQSSIRPTLDYHTSDDKQLTRTRGYHLYSFIEGFTGFLQAFGFDVHSLNRDFLEFDVKASQPTELALDQIRTVYVLDVRFAQESIPLEPCLEIYRAAFPTINFQQVNNLDALPPDDRTPMLIFQDAEKKAFDEGMPLAGRDDPYRTIYRCYPHIPKQFVNVNSKNVEEWADAEGSDKKRKKGRSRQEYLNYSLATPPKGSKAEEQAKTIARVNINQLFLKHLIVSGASVTTGIPGFPTEWMFIRVEHRKLKDMPKRRFKIGLLVKDDQLVFLDWDNDAEKEQIYDILDDWGVSDTFDEVCLKDRYDSDNGKQPDPRPEADVIVGPGLCLRIDTLAESIMYDYNLLSEHSALNTTLQPIDDLKLLPHFEELKPDGTPNRNDIEAFWRSPDGHNEAPVNATSKEALRIYDMLNAYDAWLDDLFEQQQRHSISVNDVLSALRKSTPKPTVPGHPNRTLSADWILNRYADLRMYGSKRSAELTSTYTGIWYTADNHYVVGDTNAMNSTQARAQLVRHVHVEQAPGDFDMNELLRLTSVTFIRMNQYTVVPYPFRIIGMYIENVLLPQLSEEEDDNSITDHDL